MQFDLRFYVVALIFIIFDVEVAFLFPWATVFGKANHLVQETAAVATAVDGDALSATEIGLFRELGVRNPSPVGQSGAEDARTLLKLTVVEVLVFFLILLIGFAYVWRMGALDWVRALTQEHRAQPSRRVSPLVPKAEPVISA